MQRPESAIHGPDDPQSTSVKVAVRVRPLNQHELMVRPPNNLPTEVILLNPAYPTTLAVMPDQKQFKFDHIFHPGSSQAKVYSETVYPMLHRFLEGYNVTILAYGQTSSGKTHTMGTGDATGIISVEKLGIIPRAVTDIFAFLKHLPPTTRAQVRISFLEIYNEDLIDLLATPALPHSSPDQLSAAAAQQANVQIREDPHGKIYWVGVREVPVGSAEEVMRQLATGSWRRQTGSTDMNEKSSRSHAIFSVTLRQDKWRSGESSNGRSRTPVMPASSWRDKRMSMPTGVASGRLSSMSVDGGASGDGEWTVITSKMHFVDLAGSERLKRTNASGDRAKEGININQGLSALGNVISALSEGRKKGGHVPYRDSKLTRLLQDSLGGNSQTLMIACVSPAALNHAETLNTLKYAGRTRNIKNIVSLNEEMTTDVAQLHTIIAKFKAEISRLRSLLEESESHRGFGQESDGRHRRSRSVHDRGSSIPRRSITPSPSPRHVFSSTLSVGSPFDEKDLENDVEVKRIPDTAVQTAAELIAARAAKEKTVKHAMPIADAESSAKSIHGVPAIPRRCQKRPKLPKSDQTTDKMAASAVPDACDDADGETAIPDSSFMANADPVIIEYEKIVDSLKRQLNAVKDVLREQETEAKQLRAQLWFSEKIEYANVEKTLNLENRLRQVESNRLRDQTETTLIPATPSDTQLRQRMLVSKISEEDFNALTRAESPIGMSSAILGHNVPAFVERIDASTDTHGLFKTVSEESERLQQELNCMAERVHTLNRERHIYFWLSLALVLCLAVAAGDAWFWPDKQGFVRFKYQL